MNFYEKVLNPILLKNKINLLVIVIILIVGIFYLTTIRNGQLWGDDFGLYINLAKNIAEGIEYTETGYIYNPNYPGYSPKTYPPILPLLLSPVYAKFGLNFTPMKVELIIFFLFSLYLIYLVFQEQLPGYGLLAIIVMLALNPTFWKFKDVIASDIPFLFFIFLSIFTISKAYQPEVSRNQQNLCAILAGISVYLAYGTRSIGMILIPTVILYNLINKKEPVRITIYIILIYLLLTLTQNILVHSDRSYFSQLNISLKGIFMNIIGYSRNFTMFLNNGYSNLIRYVVVLFILGFAFIGFLIRVKKKITILEIFPLIYIVPIIIWPNPQGIRFLFPVIPFIFFFALFGIQNTGLILSKRKKRLIYIILFSSVMLSYASGYRTQDFGPIREGIAKKETGELFSYIQQNTKADDVIICGQPRAISLFTGRKASIYHQTQNDRELWNYIQQIHATYIIFGKVFESDILYLQPFIEKYNHNLREVYGNNDFIVYTIINFPQFKS